MNKFIDKILKNIENNSFRDRKENSSFNIVDFDKKLINKWLENQYKEEIKRRKIYYKQNNITPTEFEISCWEDNYPYHGAIGGALTYEFTPTSIGIIFKVKYHAFDGIIELDLTDYTSF